MFKTSVTKGNKEPKKKVQNKHNGKLDKVTPKTTADGANQEADGSCNIKNDKKRKLDEENSVGIRKSRSMSAADKEPERTVQEEQDKRSAEITPDSPASSSCDVCNKVKDQSKQKPNKSKPIETKWFRQHLKFKLQPTNAERAKVSELTALLVQKSELELFEEFLDDEMFDLVQTQSNLYAQQQNRHDFDLKKYKLKRFLGFMLFSGYHRLPRERMYWENADDCSINIVTEALSRQESMDIKRNLHLADNTKVHSCNKFYKLRRYMELLLNQRFSKFGIFSHNLCVDEEMIPYFGICTPAKCTREANQ